MPEYVIKIKTDIRLANWGLEKLEDVVYDEVTKKLGGSTEVDSEGIGITDVQAVYN